MGHSGRDRAANTAVEPCCLPHPSPLIRVMLQHKHDGTSWHRAAPLTSVCPGFGFRGAGALGEWARLHHQVLGAEGIACCRKRAAYPHARSAPCPGSGCGRGMPPLCPSPAEPGAVPVIGLEKMPRACVSSTHLISKPFFLPKRGKVSEALAPDGQQRPGREPQQQGQSAGRLTDSCRRHASDPRCGNPRGNRRSR